MAQFDVYNNADPSSSDAIPFLLDVHAFQAYLSREATKITKKSTSPVHTGKARKTGHRGHRETQR